MSNTAIIVEFIERMYDENDDDNVSLPLLAPIASGAEPRARLPPFVTLCLAISDYFVLKSLHEEAGCDCVYEAKAFVHRVYAKLQHYGAFMDEEAIAEALNEACISSMC